MSCLGLVRTRKPTPAAGQFGAKTTTATNSSCALLGLNTARDYWRNDSNPEDIDKRTGWSPFSGKNVKTPVRLTFRTAANPRKNSLKWINISVSPVGRDFLTNMRLKIE